TEGDGRDRHLALHGQPPPDRRLQPAHAWQHQARDHRRADWIARYRIADIGPTACLPAAFQTEPPMDVSDLKGLYAEVTKRMKAGIDPLQHESGGVRTGRAWVTILDGVHVDAYGSKMPLNQVAGLSIPEPQLIVAQPFDPSTLGAIEK